MTNDGDLRRELRPFRALAVLSLVAPLLIYGVLGAFRYAEIGRVAEERVSRSLKIAREHALKVLGGAESAQDRVVDLAGGKSLQELRASEEALHRLLAGIVKDQVQLQAIWIIGADGRPVASSRFFPAPSIDYSDRPYFSRHRAAPGARFLTEPVDSRATGERVFVLSQSFTDAQGRFGGIVNVSLLASYYQTFYGDLVAEEPSLAISIFQDDGTIIARFPALAHKPPKMGASSPILASIRQGNAAARLRGVSSVDGQYRILAFDQVGSYPLYVSTGVNLSALRAGFFRELGFLLLLGLVPFGALFFLARVAGRRTALAIEAAAGLRRETETRLKAEEALLQAQKLEALGRLTGGVAHDFNNALMVVSNNAFLLRREVTPAGQGRLEAIGRAVDSATKLTRQLLAFSRRQALLPEVVQLQDKLPPMKELLSPVLGGRVKLAIEVDETTPAITVDAAELELALLNLAINARDAMPAGGELQIRAAPAGSGKPLKIPGEAVRIEVCDTGEGIEPETLSKVFEPFFTTKAVGLGTGLGLSQVYGFCERAGGSVAIHSVLKQGTVVSMYFPAASGGARTVTDRKEVVEAAIGKTVLVVEDNDQVADALMPLLDALGCSASRVSHARAAIDWLTTRPVAPDVVLTDVIMPGDMDGISLAQWIRSHYPGQAVILMTGYAERVDEAVAAGFEVLPKPCSPDALSAALRRAIGSGGALQK